MKHRKHNYFSVKSFLFLFLVSAFQSGYTQQWQWATNIISPNFYGGSIITTDKSNNIIVTAPFQGIITIGSTTLTSIGGSDFFVAKFNSQGTVQWVQQIKTTNDDFFTPYLITDNDNNIYFGGHFFQQAIIGNFTLNCPVENFLICKFHPDGTAAWASQFGSPANYIESLNGLTFSEGKLSVLGHFNEVIVFNPGITNLTIPAVPFTAPNGDNLFIASLDPSNGIFYPDVRILAYTCSNGNLGGPNEDTGSQIAFDSGGNILICGTYTACVKFGSSNSPSFSMYGPVAYYHAFLAKFTSDGTPVWAKEIKSQSGVYLSGLDIDDEGNPYITGSYVKNLVLSDSLQLGQPNSNAMLHSFLAKYNKNGNPVWLRDIQGGEDIAPRVSVSTCGIYVTGELTYSTQISGFPAFSSADVYVAKYSHNNDPLWLALADGQDVISGSIGKGIAISSDGMVFVCGYTGAAMSFIGSNITLTGSPELYGEIDSFFIASIHDEGTSAPITLQINGNSSVCEGQSIQLNATDGLSNYQWQKDGVTVAVDTSKITVADAGHYTVSSIGTGCASLSSASIDITVIRQVDVTVVGTDFACKGSNTTLSVPPGLGTYQWRLNGTDIPDAVSNAMSASSGGDYSVSVNENSLCPSYSDNHPVQIKDELFIPNVITPNNDSKNDFFVINGISSAAELSIYNRWGKLVFSQSHYQNNWKGDNADPGTYFYLIKNAGECSPDDIKGWIEVIR